MRVIVTGGSGRAGRYTVEELAAAGHAAFAPDHGPFDSARTIEARLGWTLRRSWRTS